MFEVRKEHCPGCIWPEFTGCMISDEQAKECSCKIESRD
jgi:hypothetical protein